MFVRNFKANWLCCQFWFLSVLDCQLLEWDKVFYSKSEWVWTSISLILLNWLFFDRVWRFFWDIETALFFKHLPDTHFTGFDRNFCYRDTTDMNFKENHTQHSTHDTYSTGLSVVLWQHFAPETKLTHTSVEHIQLSTFLSTFQESPVYLHWFLSWNTPRQLARETVSTRLEARTVLSD